MLYHHLFPIALTFAVAATPGVVFAQSRVEQLFQEGKAAEISLQDDRAEGIWRQVIQIDPNNADAYSHLGDALRRQDKTDLAQKAYEKALQLNPQEAEAYVGMGYILVDKEKLENARALCQKALQLNPKSARAYNCLGNILSGMKKLDEAISAYQKAIQLDPQLFFAYRNLGDVLYERKNLDEAIVAYQKAIQVNPKYIYAYHNLGNALSEQKKLDDAIAAYRKAIQLDPKYIYAYIGLGNALSEQKKLDDAIVAYRKAIQLDPNYAAAYYSLGIVLREQKKLDDAIAAYQKAIQLDPKNSYAYYELGNLLSDKKHYKQAITAYEQTIKLNPDLICAYPRVASIILTINSATYQETDLNKVIAKSRQKVNQIIPNLENRSSNRIVSYILLEWGVQNYVKTKNLASAIEALKKSIAIDPENQSSHVMISALFKIEGKLNDSVSHFYKYMKLKTPDINDFDIYIVMASLMLDTKSLKESIIALNRAIALRPKDANARYSLSIVLMEEKLLSQAIESFRLAIKLDPRLEALSQAININTQFMNTYLKLSRELIDTGDFNSSDEILQIALKVAPKNSNVYTHIGYYFATQRKYKEAKEAYLTGKKLNPNDVYIDFNLCELLRIQNKGAEAEPFCEKVRNSPIANGYPSNSHTLIKTSDGIANLKQCKLPEAAKNCDQAAELDPRFDPAAQCSFTARYVSDELDKKQAQSVKDDRDWLPKKDPDLGIKRSVVRITATFVKSPARQAPEIGTGIVIHREANRIFILTNRHVIFDDEAKEEAQNIQTEFFSLPTSRQQRMRRDAKIVRSTLMTNSGSESQNMDLVLLEINIDTNNPLPSDIQPLPISESQIAENLEVRIIGHDAASSKDISWSKLPGKITRYNRKELWISQANLPKGYSGSPVLDRQNQILGIVVNSRKDQNIDFAYSMSEVRQQILLWNISLK